MWYVITGQPANVAAELGSTARVAETIQRPGRSGEYVLVVSGELGQGLPSTLKIGGAYTSEEEARVAARRLADVR
jgi:hypothetical protein